MQIQLTKEQQDAVGRIKVEGGFDELYYDGPLRRGRVVVRCDGMVGKKWWYNDPKAMPLGVGVLEDGGEDDWDMWAYDTYAKEVCLYTSIQEFDYTIAASQIITPYAAELDWPGVDVMQSRVDFVNRVSKNTAAGNRDVVGLFGWADTPQGWEFWNHQDELYREGALTLELREALESYLAYAARLGVTPTVEAEKAAEPKPETDVITISIKDLRRIVRYGFDGPEQKFIDLERILKGLSV
jgi:hypothetical protein